MKRSASCLLFLVCCLAVAAAHRSALAGGFVLRGELATPDDVVHHGAVRVSSTGTIECVGDCEAPADYAVIETSGIILPGLVDPHNHVAYNIHKTPAWTPEKAVYANRYQWQAKVDGFPEQSYKDFSDRHWKLAPKPDTSTADAKTLNAEHYYAEVMALLGGVTTIEGVSLGYGRGLARNPETPRHAQPPRICASVFPIDDLNPAKDNGRTLPPYLRKCFLEDSRNAQVARLIVHLGEGLRTDEKSRGEYDEFADFFSTAGIPSGLLTVIHGVGLLPASLDDLGRRGGYLVWSPRSNKSLYGTTIDPVEVRSHGVKLALGADWTLSGSKTQLQEISYALNNLRERKLRLAGPESSDERELAIMATAAAAEASGMSGITGRLKRGLRADILVLRPSAPWSDPYSALASASERDVALVLVGGEALYGDKDLVLHEGLGLEEKDCETLERCGGRDKRLCIHAASAKDPVRISLTLKDIVATLTGEGKLTADELAPLADESCR